jgi:hypothetical protein
MLPSLAAVGQPLLVLVVAFLYSVEDQYSATKPIPGNGLSAAIRQSGNLRLQGPGCTSVSDCQIAHIARLPDEPVTEAPVRQWSNRT